MQPRGEIPSAELAVEVGTPPPAANEIGDDSASIEQPRSQFSTVVASSSPAKVEALAGQGELERTRSKVSVVEPSAPSSASSQVGVATGAQRSDSLSHEVRALREISSVVDAEPTRALSLIAKHAADYPSSQLASERRLLELRAMLRVGRRADAERLGRRLLATSVAGLYHSRVKQLLGWNETDGLE